MGVGKFTSCSSIVFLLLMFFLISLANAQIPTPKAVIDCYSTLESLKANVQMRDFLATHDCYCPSPNSSPVCTPKGGGSTSIPITPKGFTTQQQMQLMMIQGILQPVFNSIFQSAFSPVKYGPSPEELRRLEEERLRKEAEERFEILNKWRNINKQGATNTGTIKNRNKKIASLLVVDGEKDKEGDSKFKQNETPLFNDIASVFGNVIMDKTIEKIEDTGKDVIEKLSEKYGKDWGSKIYGHGLPIVKIAVAGAVEGKESAGVETVNYAVSWLCKPMTSIQSGISDIGRKIYSKIAFSSVDKFLEETEQAGNVLGFNFNKDEFVKDFEESMTTTQKILYRYFKGE
ncbi:MAG: hypothetical protein N2202_01345 [Proteobacteria bacterium]|nr:hypothetical protein [Pseudomonadota bacterium]